MEAWSYQQRSSTAKSPSKPQKRSKPELKTEASLQTDLRHSLHQPLRQLLNTNNYCFAPRQCAVTLHPARMREHTQNDLLFMDVLNRNACWSQRKANRLEAERLKLAEEEVAECSFKPVTTEYRGKSPSLARTQRVHSYSARYSRKKRLGIS